MTPARSAHAAISNRGCDPQRLSLVAARHHAAVVVGENHNWPPIEPWVKEPFARDVKVVAVNKRPRGCHKPLLFAVIGLCALLLPPRPIPPRSGLAGSLRRLKRHRAQPLPDHPPAAPLPYQPPECPHREWHEGATRYPHKEGSQRMIDEVTIQTKRRGLLMLCRRGKAITVHIYIIRLP